VRGERRDVPAAEKNGARTRAQHPGDRTQCGRFAGTIGADEGDDLALGDLETEIAADRHLAVSELEPLRLQQRLQRVLRDARERLMPRDTQKSRPDSPAPRPESLQKGAAHNP
jgi:hypothetical protein